jgi:hypothetical protein
VADPSHPRGPTGTRHRRRVAGLIAFGAVVAALAGCLPGALNQGNPAEPVLISGRVEAADGRPVGNAQLLVNVFGDSRNAAPGTYVGNVFEQTFAAGPDGTFTLHLAPTPGLRAAGLANGGFVNFQVTAIWGSPETIGLFAFPRELGGQGWADAAPTIVLRPIGAPVQPQVDPNMPVPQPVES